MGYRHIDNLYKNKNVLMFKELFALEKIHGTSANIKWKDGKLTFFSGGESFQNFVSLFDQYALREAFSLLGTDNMTIFGEAYGGKQQKQAWRYGPKLKFVAFEVLRGEDQWCDVPGAEYVVKKLGLEFVHYKLIPATIEAIDAERDAPSEQAKRNGVEGDQPREGVVLRPIKEVTFYNNGRIMAKHKRDEERETASIRKLSDEELIVLTRAKEIAEEWVTPTRLEHVLDKLKVNGQLPGMEIIPRLITAMSEDVTREGAGEIIASKDLDKEIGRRTVLLFKNLLNGELRGIK